MEIWGITHLSLARLNCLWRSTIATMVNHGLAAVMSLSSLPLQLLSNLSTSYWRLAVALFVLVSTLFRYLDSGHFHFFERDELSLLAALRYELPSQGLLNKRPLIRKEDDMDFSGFGKDNSFGLIYASAVFLHIPDQLVWVGLERLALKLKPEKRRIFVSHNIKFCSKIKEECSKRLEKIGLEYSGNHTHDSLLYNHYEFWYEFRRDGNKSYL